jgi:TPR repeat protein
MKRAAFAAITLLGLSSPVIAGPFEDAHAAYDRGDYATSLQLISPLVGQGSSRAQYDLGVHYIDGYGVPQNDAEAAKWFRLSDRRPHARRQWSSQPRYRSVAAVGL